MSRSRRRLAKGTRPRGGYRDAAPAAQPGPAEGTGRLSLARALERIGRARLQRDELDAELGLLIDHAVSLGIGWPEIARRLG
ncbi:MAG: hypothetical protein ACRDOH_26695 [Streptosporangiaceae bacterium]